MSDQFCLKWNNHHTTLVAVFDKLFECESLVDCTVAAEGKFVKAHKVVLSACSSYLEELLQNHDDKHPILIFNDISYVELKAMLEYMYRGEVNVSQDQLNTFLKAAEALRIKGLTTDQGGGDGGGGELNDLKKKMPRKEPRTNSPVLGTTPVERPPSPKRKRRMSSRDENYANDSNSCDTAPTPPPASGHNAVTKLEEKLSRLKRDGGSAESTNLQSGTTPSGTPVHKLLQPKTEFIEEPSNAEDVSLEDEEDYGPNPGTSQASFSSQDFNNWQLGEATGDEVFMAGQHDLNNTAGNSQADLRMRCDPCKIRFLKVPWFIGHLVRCSRWKENGKDVIDYFSAVSKKKLVIMRRPNKKEEKKPPTCFSCFCGKTFMSPTLHSSHVQQCLSKVMSTKPNLTVAQVKSTKEPEARPDPQEDEGFTIQMIPQSQDDRHQSVELEEVTIHEGGEVHEKELETETCDAEQPVDIRSKDNVVVVVKSTGSKEDQNVSMSHEESLEVLHREIMHEDSLEGQELDDTVMQLEYFEDEQHDDPHVASEVEVGTYEEVTSYVHEERIREEGTSPGVSPPKNNEKTLVIDTAVCDCGKKCRNAEDLTNHLKFCSYYRKSPQKRPEKRVVLITCVCKAQFTKVDIKEHLLSCETWKYVKRKKNLDKSPTLEGSRIKQELFEETGSAEDVEHHEPEIHEEIEEEPTSTVECYEQEVVTQTDDLVEELVSSPLNESNQSDVQIGEIVTISNEATEGISSRTSMQVRSPSSSADQSEATFAVEIPKVTYKCECGAIFRHANVYQVHQTGCEKYLAAHGKISKDKEHTTSLDRSTKKQDIILKYSGPMRGEVLKKCPCGYVIDSIFSYRQHTANCPSFRKDRLSSPRLKTHVPASPKRPPLVSETKRSSKDSDDDSNTTPGGVKKSKVELRDELKDFVKLPDPEKQEAMRTRRKK